MRNFRKAALAGATAVAVTFGSASVAAAQTTDNQEVVTDTAGTGSLSSQIGKALEAWEVNDEGQTVKNGADGEVLFGSSDEGGNFSSEPLWAQLLYIGSIFAGVSSFIGLIVGPAYNFVVHGL